MAKLHGKGTVVFVDEFDLTTFLNSFEATSEISTADVTCFGATGSARSFVTGLVNGTITAAGLYDPAAGASDVAIQADIASASNRVITAGYAGSTVGNVCKMLAADYTNYTVSSPVDGPVASSLAAQGNGGIQSGKFLHALAATTGDADGTSVDGAAASTAGWVAHIHVTAVSGTNPTLDVKLQDSADDSSWADVSGGAFAQKTAVGSERITGTGTLRRYTRINRDTGGTDTPTFTFTVAVARRAN